MMNEQIAQQITDIQRRLDGLERIEIGSGAGESSTVRAESTATVGAVGYLQDHPTYGKVWVNNPGLNYFLVGDIAIAQSDGAIGSMIKVVRRGRVSIQYNGSAPAVGNFMVTSATANKADAITFMRPEVFAFVVQAGAGGLVLVDLYTQRNSYLWFPTQNILRVPFQSSSDFLATIQSTGATTLVYNTGWTGHPNTAAPTSSLEYGNIVLYNLTRGGAGLRITNNNIGVRAFTFLDNVPGSWVAGDTITTRSQTNTTSVGGLRYFFDVDMSQVLPHFVTGIAIQKIVSDSGGGGVLGHAPYEAYNDAKHIQSSVHVANRVVDLKYDLPIINDRFTYDVFASGFATCTIKFKLMGIEVATL